jgi:hypothetical protein
MTSLRICFGSQLTARSIWWRTVITRPAFDLNVDDELAANRDRFLQGLNATLKTTKQLTVDGRKGIEFTGESDQASFKSRVFIFGTRFHQMAIAVFKGNDDTESANRFFASFEFTKAEARPKS